MWEILFSAWFLLINNLLQAIAQACYRAVQISPLLLYCPYTPITYGRDKISVAV